MDLPAYLSDSIATDLRPALQAMRWRPAVAGAYPRPSTREALGSLEKGVYGAIDRSKEGYWRRCAWIAMKFRPQEMRRLSTTRDYFSAELIIVKRIVRAMPQPRMPCCSGVGSAIYCAMRSLLGRRCRDP